MSLQSAETREPRTSKLQWKAGRVKWFSKSKGYGFITRINEPDTFIHITTLQNHGIEHHVLTKGRLVEFQADKGGKGPRVISIKLPSKES